MCDFVLFGASGFIGEHILDALDAQGYQVRVPERSLRLHQAEQIEAFLQSCVPIAHGVVCAAGVRGTPNIDWCNEHPCETIEANIVGQLNVARACRVLGNVHCTFVGSCMVYPPIPAQKAEREGESCYYDEERDRVRGGDYVDGNFSVAGGAPGNRFKVKVGGKEGGHAKTAGGGPADANGHASSHAAAADDGDNGSAATPAETTKKSGSDYHYEEFSVHFYRKARCVLEDLLQYYPNVLNLRVQFPVSMKDRELENKNNLITKLRNFKRIDGSCNSVTFLDNLCPVLPRLVKRKVTGNLNFVNPGRVDYVADIVAPLKKKIEGYDPEIVLPLKSAAGSGAAAAAFRGSILLRTDKLVREGHSQEYPILSSKECLDMVFA
eukprot:g20283.t1